MDRRRLRALMLSEFARGLGTCWIGFEQSYLNAGKEALGLPASSASVAPIRHQAALYL